MSSRPRQLFVAGGVLLIAALITGATVMALGAAADNTPAANPTQGVLGVESSPARPTAAHPGSISVPTLEPVAVASQLAPSRGSIVYSDDFHDSKTGWADSSLNTADDTFNFTASGYVIGSAGGSLEHWIDSPYRDGKGQLSMSLTATQVEGPAGLGLGVACRRGDGTTRITYSFLIVNDGTFTVARRDGSGLDSPEVVLQKGASPVKPGSTAITVVGMCATLDDGKTTRLVLFAGDQMLADFTDKTSLSGPGWLGGIDMLSGKGPSFITAKHWEERDLSA